MVDRGEVSRGRTNERKGKARFEDDDDDAEEAHRHRGMIME